MPSCIHYSIATYNLSCLWSFIHSFIHYVYYSYLNLSCTCGVLYIVFNIVTYNLSCMPVEFYT